MNKRLLKEVAKTQTVRDLLSQGYSPSLIHKLIVEETLREGGRMTGAELVLMWNDIVTNLEDVFEEIMTITSGGVEESERNKRLEQAIFLFNNSSKEPLERNIRNTKNREDYLRDKDNQYDKIVDLIDLIAPILTKDKNPSNQKLDNMTQLYKKIKWDKYPFYYLTPKIGKFYTFTVEGGTYLIYGARYKLISTDMNVEDPKVSVNGPVYKDFKDKSKGTQIKDLILPFRGFQKFFKLSDKQEPSDSGESGTEFEKPKVGSFYEYIREVGGTGGFIKGNKYEVQPYKSSEPDFVILKGFFKKDDDEKPIERSNMIQWNRANFKTHFALADEQKNDASGEGGLGDYLKEWLEDKSEAIENATGIGAAEQIQMLLIAGELIAWLVGAKVVKQVFSVLTDVVFWGDIIFLIKQKQYTEAATKIGAEIAANVALSALPSQTLAQKAASKMAGSGAGKWILDKIGKEGVEAVIKATTSGATKKATKGLAALVGTDIEKAETKEEVDKAVNDGEEKIQKSNLSDKEKEKAIDTIYQAARKKLGALGFESGNKPITIDKYEDLFERNENFKKIISIADNINKWFQQNKDKTEITKQEYESSFPNTLFENTDRVQQSLDELQWALNLITFFEEFAKGETSITKIRFKQFYNYFQDFKSKWEEVEELPLVKMDPKSEEIKDKVDELTTTAEKATEELTGTESKGTTFIARQSLDDAWAPVGEAFDVYEELFDTTPYLDVQSEVLFTLRDRLLDFQKAKFKKASNDLTGTKTREEDEGKRLKTEDTSSEEDIETTDTPSDKAGETTDTPEGEVVEVPPEVKKEIFSMHKEIISKTKELLEIVKQVNKDNIMTILGMNLRKQARLKAKELLEVLLQATLILDEMTEEQKGQLEFKESVEDKEEEDKSSIEFLRKSHQQILSNMTKVDRITRSEDGEKKMVDVEKYVNKPVNDTIQIIKDISPMFPTTERPFGKEGDLAKIKKQVKGISRDIIDIISKLKDFARTDKTKEENIEKLRSYIARAAITIEEYFDVEIEDPKLRGLLPKKAKPSDASYNEGASEMKKKLDELMEKYGSKIQKIFSDAKNKEGAIGKIANFIDKILPKGADDKVTDQVIEKLLKDNEDFEKEMLDKLVKDTQGSSFDIWNKSGDEEKMMLISSQLKDPENDYLPVELTFLEDLIKKIYMAIYGEEPSKKTTFQKFKSLFKENNEKIELTRYYDYHRDHLLEVDNIFIDDVLYSKLLSKLRNYVTNPKGDITEVETAVEKFMNEIKEMDEIKEMGDEVLSNIIKYLFSYPQMENYKKQINSLPEEHYGFKVGDILRVKKDFPPVPLLSSHGTGNVTITKGTKLTISSMKPSKKDEEAIAFRFEEEESIQSITLTEEEFNLYFEAYAPEAKVDASDLELPSDLFDFGEADDDKIPKQEQIERKLEVIIERFINQRKKQWRKRTM